MKEILKKSLPTIFFGLALTCLALSVLVMNLQVRKMNEKMDDMASQTDAIVEKVDTMDSDFKSYRQGNKDIIDVLNKQINDFINDMQDEINRIDEDIDAVEVAKKEAKKTTYVASSAPTTTSYVQNSDGLTKSAGVNYYGEQKETYYNLNMSRVVSNAQNSGLEGDYWVRDDGAKMFGDYVIVAANQDVHPYGTTVETSLGTGIVLDTGGFAAGNPTQVDIATDW